ncbi:MAG TPA: prepilin-type N-terminal cleavage/methylation domain-containing protein [Thermoanaerobaculia bacterium]|nr:prepilin-type N-terminal cleavage/methylation domain-containing protein [Thermoanaerobaculia bacterium]
MQDSRAHLRNDWTEKARVRCQRGFSLLELLIIVALVGVLSALLIPFYLDQIQRSRLARALEELRTLADSIEAYESDLGGFPEELEEAVDPPPRDPWGNLYQYLPSTDPEWDGKRRKDRFLVPLNSDYDLYSSGPDGNSNPPLTAQASRDDIVRADNGSFFGVAADF